ncbi:hypothetical protein BDF19DRAFT_432022 [Syncephalis fuscata]|nr:hypothetical protein BDF19DRAFT_432022 [Syncephalis fuscata]
MMCTFSVVPSPKVSIMAITAAFIIIALLLLLSMHASGIQHQPGSYVIICVSLISPFFYFHFHFPHYRLFIGV